MKKTLINTLDKLKLVLEVLDDQQYTNNQVPPFYSSIGSHVRHVLNFYDAVILGWNSTEINLIKRTRKTPTEVSTAYALKHIDIVSSCSS